VTGVPKLCTEETRATVTLVPEVEPAVMPIGSAAFDRSERRQLARNLTWGDCVQGLATDERPSAHRGGFRYRGCATGCHSIVLK
jgi:hypothetical protein